MGKIDVFSKWSLDKNNWIDASEKDRFRSFAMAYYDPIFNNSTRAVNYIIVYYGDRVEDLSKDSVNIRNNKSHINKFINYFSKDSTNNYIIKYVMLDADAPIIEESKELAHYIDSIASLFNTKSVNVIGLSKCGALNMYIPRFFDNPDSYKVTNIYNVATPYNGTLIASPLLFYPKVRELVINKFGDNKFSNKVYESLISFYESISSNSHMDYDIAKLDGVPADRLDKYDRSFVENMFCSENISAISKINSFSNFTTQIGEHTLNNAIKRLDFVSIGLCIMSDWFFEEPSDGLVLTSEQHLIDNYLDSSSINLITTHNFTSSNEFYKVLNKVSENVFRTQDFQRKRG